MCRWLLHWKLVTHKLPRRILQNELFADRTAPIGQRHRVEIRKFVFGSQAKYISLWTQLSQIKYARQHKTILAKIVYFTLCRMRWEEQRCAFVCVGPVAGKYLCVDIYTMLRVVSDVYNTRVVTQRNRPRITYYALRWALYDCCCSVVLLCVCTIYGSPRQHTGSKKTTEPAHASDQYMACSIHYAVRETRLTWRDGA